jgi:hypothetical protein
MENRRISVGVVVALLAVLTLVPSAVVSAQNDPHAGTWVLNVAKSKYTPGPPPRQQTSVFSVSGQTVKVITKGVGPLGMPTTTEYTATFDGKDHAVSGNPDWDTVALKRIDSHTIEFTRKRGGKVVQTATSVVSKDGKTRTITTAGTNAQGQKISTVGVYERK